MANTLPRANSDMVPDSSEKADDMAKKNVMRRQIRPNGNSCPPTQSPNHPAFEERNKTDKSIADPVVPFNYREKETFRGQMDCNKRLKTVDNNEMKIGKRDNIDIGE